MNIARSHLFSRLLYGAGGWPKLTLNQTKAVTSTSMHVWRRATRTTFKDRADAGLGRISDHDVIRQHALSLPTTMVSLLRINLFIRVVISSNSTLKAIVYAAKNSKKSWLAAVVEDFEWLRSCDASSKDPPLSRIKSIQEWIPCIQQAPTFWKTTVRNKCLSPAANIPIDPEVFPSMTIVDVQQCSECVYTCSSHQQLQLHRFKIHGHINPARRYVDALMFYPACLRRYETRTQALQHVTLSKNCAGYASIGDDIYEEVRDTLDKAEAARIRLEKSDGAACVLSNSLFPLTGPLRKQHVAMFKGRPLYQKTQVEARFAQLPEKLQVSLHNVVGLLPYADTCCIHCHFQSSNE